MAAPAVQKRDGSGTYTFSSRPHAIQQRKKYRDPYEKWVIIFGFFFVTFELSLVF